MKIFCVGRNYSEHVAELGNSMPESPVIFMKPKSALLNLGFNLLYPSFTNELHYEGELVLKIGKNGRYIDAYNALSYITEISVGIDFTARDVQNYLKEKGLPWEKAKAFDGSAAVGEFIPFNPNMLDNGINFSLLLNGQTVQQVNSNKMINTIPAIIEDISQYFSLNIGDLIFTGTPSGVGECTVTDVFEGYIENKKLLKVGIK